MNNIEIAVAASVLLLVQLIGSARDALFDRGTIVSDDIRWRWRSTQSGANETQYVSWKWRHYFIWGERWPVQSVAFVMLVKATWSDVWMPFYLLLALFVISLHSPLYRWIYIHRWKFAGDESKPAWYVTLRKLWTWIPWT